MSHAKLREQPPTQLNHIDARVLAQRLLAPENDTDGGEGTEDG
jgi:hypothetical protein